MLYAKTTLLKDEKIILFTRPHPIIFSQTITWWIAALLFMLFSPVFQILGLMFLVVGILHGVWALIYYYCSEYVITNKRIIMKVGFISRSSLELFLHRIEGIFFWQSICGRIFNYGAITIGGIGGSKDSFYYVPNPIGFRNTAQEQIEKATKVL
jgi:uncharacterized membrane protein YdbT with pleckstrin-like domain